jgi:hypothetical protein
MSKKKTASKKIQKLSLEHRVAMLCFYANYAKFEKSRAQKSARNFLLSAKMNKAHGDTKSADQSLQWRREYIESANAAINLCALESVEHELFLVGEDYAKKVELMKKFADFGKQGHNNRWAVAPESTTAEVRAFYDKLHSKKEEVNAAQTKAAKKKK